MSAKVFFRRFALAMSFVFLFTVSRSLTRAANLSLAWNPSPSPSVVGYLVGYGLTSSNYSSYVDVGTNTNVTLTGLNPGTTYYAAVTAYDGSEDESQYSNQIEDVIPALPVITVQPQSQTAVAGTMPILLVGVTTTGSCTWQWYEGANALAGATSLLLMLPNVSDANEGNYFVVISNAGGSVTSSVVSLSVADPPTIITQPISQTVVVGGSPLFSVGVEGSGPFTFQWYSGGNAIPSGNKATLHLSNVTTANSGNYYVTIKDSAGVVTSSVVALNLLSSLPLTSASALAPAPVSAAGTYNGLFYQTNGTNLPNVTEQTAGMLGNVVVGTSGVYSGKVYVGGYSYTVSGTFGASGTDTEIVSRAANNFSNLTVALQLAPTGAIPAMTGSVSNMDPKNAWTSPLQADLATNALPVPVEVISMLIPPVAGSPNSPAGYGSAQIIVSASGQATLAGGMADTATFSQSMPVGPDGTIPVYVSLYGGAGLLEGWVSVVGDKASGLLTWARPAGIVTAIPYPLGFTNVITIGSGLVVP